MPIAQLLSNTLKSPLWAAQLATGAKSFVDNPILGSEPLNRAGLHTVRVRLAHAMAALRRRQLAHLVSAQDRTDFARDGFIKRADFMPADLHKAVYAEVIGVAAEGREQVQGDTVTRRIPLDPATLRQMPAMRQLLAMPEWKNLLRYVSSFNCEPILTVQTILSHVTDAPPDPQTQLPHRHLPPDHEGLAIPHRRRRRRGALHLCSGLAPADQATAGLGASHRHQGGARRSTASAAAARSGPPRRN